MEGSNDRSHGNSSQSTSSPSSDSSFSWSELPPPHRFRRQNLPEIQKQDLVYLASYRAATGKMLNAELEGARRLSQEEVMAIARHIYTNLAC